MFGSAAFHMQDSDTMEYVNQYPIHRDKTGRITAFYQVEGWSFNFFAVQHKSLQESKFLEDDGYQYYQIFKHQHMADEQLMKKLDRFEKNILRESNIVRNNFCGRLIRIIPLIPRKYVVFDATTYLHGTIIPMQGNARSLLIFHDLKKGKLTK